MRLMRLACFLLAGLACAAIPSSAGERRQLSAHVHGHGRLNIAIEGSKLSMELEAPGADIAGFEHEASTDGEKAAISDAKTKLANPLALFGPASAAGCAPNEAKVSVEAEHEHGDAHDSAAHEDEAGHNHSEFRASYTLTCASPAALTSLTFGYFNAFAGAHELDVAVIGPKGQSSFEVTRANPTLDLTGVR
jgi:hypothetical protein